MNYAQKATDSLLPVILGGDVGSYALGLECHEAYGVRSLCLSANPVDMITRSAIFDVHRTPSRASDDQLLEVLGEVASDHSDKQLLLLTNSDGHVDFLVRYREQLASQYLMPIPSAEALALLGDKVSFAEVAASVGVPTPQTVVVDFTGSESADWKAPAIDIRFPVVAKAASGAAYEKVTFPGKEKIWFIDTPAELDSLWEKLRGADFRDQFLVQETIPGDDTAMRSLTFYVDSAGKVTLRSGAQVLLQDPLPQMIGNPIAMITGPQGDLWDMGERILHAGGYKGFANFDIKVDPRDGTPYFLEVNPRIGRNSYYVVGGGQNPMVPMIEDLVKGESPQEVTADDKCLYTLVPLGLIKKYVSEPDLVEEAVELSRQGKRVDPLRSPIEKSWQRRAIAWLQRLNYHQKFRKHWRFGEQ